MTNVTQEIIVDIVAGQLRVPRTSLAVETPFYELGLDSLSGIRLLAALEERLGMELDPMLLLDFTSIETLAARLDQLKLDERSSHAETPVGDAGVRHASDKAGS
ncbi:acyl carrier protein [Variovorax boronicumulans]|uniref:acyl carrier protein n=1 Tax=Variovorax boronicumulans TaxID=436515 RepID=UPI003397E8CA